MKYQSTDLLRAVPQEIAINIYRIAQEALRNISRHARATSVDIALAGMTLPTCHCGNESLYLMPKVLSSIFPSNKGVEMMVQAQGVAKIGVANIDLL